MIEYRIVKNRAEEARKITSQVWNKTPSVRLNTKANSKFGQPQRLSMYSQNAMKKNTRRPLKKPLLPASDVDVEPRVITLTKLVSSPVTTPVGEKVTSDFGFHERYTLNILHNNNCISIIIILHNLITS